MQFCYGKGARCSRDSVIFGVMALWRRMRSIGIPAGSQGHWTVDLVWFSMAFPPMKWTFFTFVREGCPIENPRRAQQHGNGVMFYPGSRNRGRPRGW